jgi:CelD/BcsL family acetyltransferase involved in cellulose biosynthesis
MPQLAQRCGLPVEVENEDVCPVITLPSTYDQYLEQLDKKQRHELRRKRRRAEEYGVTFEVIGQDDDLELAIDDFFRLMELSTPDKAAFLQVPGHRAFFREIGHRTLKQNILKLLFLTVEGERVAALWQFHYHDRMMLYNSGLNPTAFSALSSGIALLTYSIEDAIARGCRIYDFLQGDEEYKYRMGSAATTVHNLNIWRKPRQQR